MKIVNSFFSQLKNRASWAAIIVLLTASNIALSQQAYRLEFGASGSEDQVELQLPVGKSQIIRADDKLDQVVIGNPNVADIKLLSDRQVLILGIKPGHTNLAFKSKRRDLVALMDIVVGYDIAGIQRKFREVMPQERLLNVATSNDAVIVSGHVSSTASLEKAIAIANSYVPADHVINLVNVGGGHQVMLQVKISEVSRNSLKELGINSTITGNQGDPETAIFAGAIGISGTSLGTLTINELGGGVADALRLTINALESKGLAKTLAEPNLVAMSGQEASFLAGGEFPIPVAQSDTTGGATSITVEYKPFGVGLNFTPTVLSRDQINLQLATEVSAIDESKEFKIGLNVDIPALTTRRMSTTIEIGDGQSFAIAGLLQNNLSESINQFPFLGDIPVLGALFRSNSFNRAETELVVIVTPKIVRPVRGKDLSLPTDKVSAPNELEWYLLGRLEGRAGSKKASGEVGATRAGSNLTAGYQGEFGHE